MSDVRRRFAQPLPTATAVVVAVLVAMASALADANGTGGFSRSEFDARVATRLVLSGRAIASALANVAEGLEDDWTVASRRATTTTNGGLSLVALSASGGLDLRPVVVVARRCVDDDLRGCDRRTAAHRRLLNLPPPAVA